MWRRWILPVAVLGSLSVTKIFSGTWSVIQDESCCHETSYVTDGLLFECNMHLTLCIQIGGNFAKTS